LGRVEPFGSLVAVQLQVYRFAVIIGTPNPCTISFTVPPSIVWLVNMRKHRNILLLVLNTGK